MKPQMPATPLALAGAGLVALAIVAYRSRTGSAPAGTTASSGPGSSTIPAPLHPASLSTLVMASIHRSLGLVASGALRLCRDRIGERYRIDEGGTYEIFRETVTGSGAPDDAAVLVVGFHLRLVRSLAPLHWLFQRVCILTTPFWSGFRGFHIKLWMVEPRTKDYLGIYEWDGAANAQTYVDALGRVLRPLSSPDSVWYQLCPDQLLEPFLEARKLEVSQRRTAPRAARGPRLLPEPA